jgi:aldehyde dehydrogenase (NAD+)
MSLPYSLSKLPTQLFINNEYVESKNTKKLSLYNPKDGSLVADNVSLADEHDVDAAVDAAEKAFPAWKRVSATERRKIMNKFADLVETHAQVLSEMTRVTLGSPYEAFGKFEVGLCADVRTRNLKVHEKSFINFLQGFQVQRRLYR